MIKIYPLASSSFSKLLLCCCFITSFPCSSTEHSAISQCTPAWNGFEGNDKLSSTIHSSIRGGDGLIYVGGRDGLYRLGGGSVKTWLPDFTNLAAIPSGHVKALAIDNQYIWVGSHSGISRLNTKDGTIERNESFNKSTGYASINSIVVQGKLLFVATSTGGYIAKITDNIADLSILERFDNTGALNAIKDINAKVIGAGKSGLWLLDAAAPPQKLPLEAADLKSIAYANNAIWVASNDALYQQGSRPNEWIRHTDETLSGLPDSEFTALTTDKFGRLWIGATKGLSRWDFAHSHPTPCRRSIVGSERDRDISIAHLSGELGDYMFLGTRGRGATHAPFASGVRLVVPGGHYDNGLPPNAIWSHLINQQERFIAGTSRGVFIETEPGAGFFTPLAQDALGNLRIYNLAEMDNGNLWIGTAKGLFIQRGETITSIPLLTDEDNTVIHPSVFSIKVHRDRVFLATSMGFIALDRNTQALAALFKTKEHIQGYTQSPTALLPVSRIWSMDFSGERIFIAGNEGAFEIDIESMSVLSSTLSAPSENTQPIGYIYNVTVVADDRLFLGTEAGLVETNFSFSSYQKITQINGRQLTSVMSSGRDSNGDTWIGVANNGLFRYQKNTNNWTHLTQSDGLITNGVSQLGLSFTDNGQMSISNATGASIVNLNRLNLTAPLPVSIRAIDMARNTLFEQGDSYQIGPENRDLSLSFVATELIEPELYSVQYELVTEGGSSRTAIIAMDDTLSFINLSHGLYQFKAIVRGTSGTASEPIEFYIEALPLWWESILFRVSVFAIFIISLIIFFYRKSKQVELRLDVIANERKRIAQELHDTSLQDIFGAKMIGRMLKADLPESEKPKVDRFMVLIDRSIDSLRSSVDSLSNLTNVPPISVAIAELKQTINLPEHTAVQINETGKAWHLRHSRRFFVYRIVREAMNNAAKHSEATDINVSLDWSIWYLHIAVNDNGNGFDFIKRTKADTYGLKSMQCMADTANIKLAIESIPNKGTEIRLKVPRLFM